MESKSTTKDIGSPTESLLNKELTQTEWDALCVVHRLRKRLGIGFEFGYDSSSVLTMGKEYPVQIIQESVFLEKESTNRPNMIPLDDVVLILAEIRTHRNLRNFQDYYAEHFCQHHGLNQGQVNFLVSVVAAERAKTNIED